MFKSAHNTHLMYNKSVQGTKSSFLKQIYYKNYICRYLYAAARSSLIREAIQALGKQPAPFNNGWPVTEYV